MDICLLSSGFHPCHGSCICSSHRICLTIWDLLCGLCFIHHKQQSCYFCDLLPFGTDLTLPVSPSLQPLSNILAFWFLCGSHLSSFHIYFSMCLILPMCFTLRIYLSDFENVSQDGILFFSFSLPGLYLFNILHPFCALLLAWSVGFLQGNSLEWARRGYFQQTCLWWELLYFLLHLNVSVRTNGGY